MATPRLRPYQTRLVDQLARAVDEGRHALCIAPTGAGKTIVFAELASRARGRVLILAPWRVLVDQTARAIARHGIEVSVSMAGRPDPDTRVVVGSVETVSRRRIERADLLILDEAHRLDTAARRRIVERCRAARGVVVGLTATPWGPRGPLAGYDVAAIGPSPRELVDMGHLRRPRFYARHVVEDLAQRDGRGIVFAPSVDAAHRYRRELLGRGVRSEVVYSGQRARDRDAAIAAYEAGNVAILSNYAVLTEGFDAVVDGVDLARTMNLRLYVQAIGRALRPSGAAVASIGDPSGLVARYGDPLDLPWPLWGPPRPTRHRASVCRDCAEIELDGREHECQDYRRTVPSLAQIQAQTGLSAVWTAEQCAARGYGWHAGRGEVVAELELERALRGLGERWLAAQLAALRLS